MGMQSGNRQQKSLLRGDDYVELIELVELYALLVTQSTDLALIMQTFLSPTSRHNVCFAITTAQHDSPRLSSSGKCLRVLKSSKPDTATLMLLSRSQLRQHQHYDAFCIAENR
jgi:hypothetical protein